MSAATRLVKYIEYAENWQPAGPCDMILQPKGFNPPARKTAFEAFWGAIDRRNVEFEQGIHRKGAA